MTAVTYPSTVAKRLAAGGSSWTMPTTRAGIDKRLEAIAAGKGGHKPTDAHPYRACFEGSRHVHWTSGRTTSEVGGKSYRDAYGEPLDSCEEYIRQCESDNHPADCGYCQAGEAMAHNYEPA